MDMGRLKTTDCDICKNHSALVMQWPSDIVLEAVIANLAE